MMRLLAVVAFASGAQLCPPCFHLQNALHGNRTRQSMGRLHIPKTGSTFQNTVFIGPAPACPIAGYGPGAAPIRFAKLYDGSQLNRTLCDRDDRSDAARPQASINGPRRRHGGHVPPAGAAHPLGF